MEYFLTFFDKLAEKYPLRLELGYTRNTYWGLRIYLNKYGREEKIAEEESCDVHLLFAKAEVALKDWLCNTYGGY